VAPHGSVIAMSEPDGRSMRARITRVMAAQVANSGKGLGGLGERSQECPEGGGGGEDVAGDAD
jgi:hypothetical protein